MPEDLHAFYMVADSTTQLAINHRPSTQKVNNDALKNFMAPLKFRTTLLDTNCGASAAQLAARLKDLLRDFAEEGYDMANVSICVVWSGNDIFVGGKSIGKVKKHDEHMNSAMENVKALRKMGDQFPNLFYIAAGNGRCWNEESFDELSAPLLSELSNGKHLVYNGVPIYQKMVRAAKKGEPKEVDYWHFSSD